MPNVVKGSRQDRVRVVPYRPARQVLFILAIVAITVTGMVGSYFIGFRQVAMQDQSNIADRSQLRAQLDSLELENSQLRSQIALLDRSSAMDQQSNDQVQNTILEMRERIAQLEQDVLFYRQVMSEDIENIGLVIGQMDIEATELPGQFSYKLVLRQQESNNDSYLTGYVNVNIVATMDEEPIVIPLRELTSDEDQVDIKLRFKYFQNIEGRLEIPKGVIPDQVQITAVETAPMAKTINKSFSWVVEGD